MIDRSSILRLTGLMLSFAWLTGVSAVFALTGCASQAVHEVRGPLQTAPSPVMSLPEGWQALAARLEADALYGPDLDAAFRAAPPPTQDPMGRKIHELYLSKFAPPPPPPPPGTPKREPVYVYPKVVTAENAALCKAFITQHEAAFARAEQRYGVPRDIAVALMFVETRLGRSLGKNDVFHTLASMASSRDPSMIDTWLAKLDQPETQLGWIRETMHKRADWAYKELVAFITHARANGLDHLGVPGSVYGAMGICQFMPSNLAPYGADGNEDGVINLFVVDDAIASLANYLTQNGWKPGLGRAGQHAALKRYNRLNIYANTILALADLVRGEVVGKPVTPGGAKKKPPAKSAKTTAKQPAAKGKK